MERKPKLSEFVAKIREDGGDERRGWPPNGLGLPSRRQASIGGFVLDPNGHVNASVYSSGATGRLVPGDVTGLLDDLKAKQPA